MKPAFLIWIADTSDDFEDVKSNIEAQGYEVQEWALLKKYPVKQGRVNGREFLFLGDWKLKELTSGRNKCSTSSQASKPE